MKHVDPKSLWLPDRKIIRPQAFIPGLSPCPKIIGAAREITPGSRSWTSPGTYNFNVPNFNTLTVTVKGAGGGGSSAGWQTSNGWFDGIAGGTGGYSQFYNATYCNMVGYGGAGGPGGSFGGGQIYYYLTPGYGGPMAPGANGSASGGDTNSAGGGAAPGSYGYASYTWSDGAGQYWGNNYGGNGGYGGAASKTFNMSMLPWGTAIQIIIGSGGYSGAIGNIYPPPPYNTEVGPTAGQSGSVSVSWS